MFKLQIEVDSIEEAERILACLRHSADPAIVSQMASQVAASASNVLSGEFTEVTNPPAEKPKRGRPRREVAAPLPEPAAPATAPTDDDQGGQAPVVASDEPAQQTYTAVDARAALQSVLVKHDGDMAPCTALLAKFGAARVSELDPSNYAAFIAACKAA